MFYIILLSTYLSLAAADLPFPDNQCAVSIEYKTGDLAEPQPLILTPNTKNKDFLYPKNDKRILRLSKGQSIYLACPGKNNYLQNVERKEATAVCVKDKIFSIDGLLRNFSSLTCKTIPEHNVRHLKSPCLGKYSTIEIGFQLNSSFLQTIEVCRDDDTYNTYYTKFRLTKAIESYQSKYPRPYKWIIGNHFPGVKVHEIYKIETQIDTVAKILNSTELAKTRINKSQFLSRGHLAAKADFVYGTQQRSTFWYLNAAPQWYSFNAGNWNTLEDNIRKFVINRRLDLDVYTGVHGNMTMMDYRGKHQQIHLYTNGTKRAMSVPKFYWKIIYEPSSKKGTAFVGANDPFLNLTMEEIYICKDISFRIKWLTWVPSNIKWGISYACTIDNLREAVPNVPSLDVIDILI